VIVVIWQEAYRRLVNPRGGEQIRPILTPI